jgi:hypothetical protein
MVISKRKENRLYMRKKNAREEKKNTESIDGHVILTIKQEQQHQYFEGYLKHMKKENKEFFLNIWKMGKIISIC